MGRHPHPHVQRSEPPQGRRGGGRRLLPNSCADSGAAGLDRKGNEVGTSNPSTGAVGGQEVRATWDHPGLRRGWLAARGFILPKGQIPRRVGVVSEGLGFGELLWSPDGKAKSPPAESWHPPGVALLSEMGLRGRRCGNRRGGEVGRWQDGDSPGSAARWL